MLLTTAISDTELWLAWATIVLKSVGNMVRSATIAKSVAKVWVLLITAVSEVALWLGLATILVKSEVNIVRSAIIVKSAAKV